MVLSERFGEGCNINVKGGDMRRLIVALITCGIIAIMGCKQTIVTKDTEPPVVVITEPADGGTVYLHHPPDYHGFLWVRVKIYDNELLDTSLVNKWERNDVLDCLPHRWTNDLLTINPPLKVVTPPETTAKVEIVSSTEWYLEAPFYINSDSDTGWHRITVIAKDAAGNIGEDCVDVRIVH